MTCRTLLQGLLRFIRDFLPNTNAAVSETGVSYETSSKRHMSSLQEFSTMASYKSVPQVSHKRVFYKSVLQECSTRVSHKSARHECSTRVSHKSVPQECPTRVFHKSVSFIPKRPTRAPPTRVSYTRVSNNVWPLVVRVPRFHLATLAFHVSSFSFGRGSVLR